MQWVLNSLFFIMKWHKWNFLIGCQWCHIQANAQVGLFLLLWTFSMTDSEFLESSCPSLVVNITLLDFCNRIENCQCVFLSLFAYRGYFSSFYYVPLLPTGAMWNLTIETSDNFLRHPFRAVFLVSWIVSKSTRNMVMLIIKRLHIICSSFISTTTKGT